MAWYFALALMVGSIFVVMTIGLIAFAFFLTNLIGAYIFLGGEAGIGAFIRGSMSAIANFNLAPIPFFLLIGEILLRTGLAYKAVDAIDNAIQRVPGRLSVVAVTGGTVFSALSVRLLLRRPCLDRLWSRICCAVATSRPWRLDPSSRLEVWTC